MRIDLIEHKRKAVIKLISTNEENNSLKFSKYKAVQPRNFIRQNKVIQYYKIYCSEDCVEVEADYYIGVDWIINNEKFVYVSPKINNNLIEKFEIETDKDTTTEDDEKEIKYAPREVNYLKMYLDVATHNEIMKHTEQLLFIDWSAPEIPIEQKEDLLTPFLIIQFLSLLKKIVRKGLKKSYYIVQTNLQGRVKGKILIEQNIKLNVLKNRLTDTICEYQEFGIDNAENRFLKKVFLFICKYVGNNQTLFSGNEATIKQIINYCSPAFENVSDKDNEHELKYIKPNAFFKDYKEATQIGQHILKRFAYSISETSQERVSTPPFWIDMPQLFELYVYHKLLKNFDPNEVKYHLSTFGNELDFLITKEGYKMVVDAKYKLHYNKGHIHDDIRQVAGYARLNKVYEELAIHEHDYKLIDCLIIYPSRNKFTESHLSDHIMEKRKEIKAYKNVFKVSIDLP